MRVRISAALFLLGFCLLGILIPSNSIAIQRSPKNFVSVASTSFATFTLTPEPSNSTYFAGDTAHAIISIKAFGTFSGTVILSYTQYNEDYLSCGAAPTPSIVTVPPDAQSTAACVSVSAGAFTLTIVGKSQGLSTTATVTLNFTSVQSSASSLPSLNTQISPYYIVIGASMVVVGLMAIITVYAFRKWKV